ncbi:hypothetical protein GH733_004708 [Mirounga leonina]|nr:hypothetical protein GH733_004708 [Mirounga leonina]
MASSSSARAPSLSRLTLTVAQRDWATSTQHSHVCKFPTEQQTGSSTLEGWDQSFPSMRELRATLQGRLLWADDNCFFPHCCCLPWPGEISNLIVMWGPQASTRPPNLRQLSHLTGSARMISPGCPTWAKARGTMCMRASYK